MQAAQLDTSVPPRGPTQIRGIGGRSQGKGGPIPRDEVAGAPKVARSASQMRDNAAPGPLTPASAPPGVHAKSQISWGGLAPGRPGREDARNSGAGALDTAVRTIRVRFGSDALRRGGGLPPQ